MNKEKVVMFISHRRFWVHHLTVTTSFKSNNARIRKLFYCRINYRSQSHKDRMNVSTFIKYVYNTRAKLHKITTFIPPITRHSVMKQTKQILTHLCSIYNSINSFFRHCCNVMLIKNCQFVQVSKAVNLL